MIHATTLVAIKSKRRIATSRYWEIEIPRGEIIEYLKSLEEIQDVADTKENIPLIINDKKYFNRQCGNKHILIFITDRNENDRRINENISNAAQELCGLIQEKGIKYVQQNFGEIIRPFVQSKLKIALVGEGGVGKTTTLHLFLGLIPPKQYVPTIALNMEVIENIYFGNYALVIWDFAGQERFRKLWKLYFKGADIVLLMTDSTLRNVLLSRDMYTIIQRDAPNVPVIVIANKQDRPNALDPSIIARVIGAETYPLVAVDIAYRERLLKIILKAVTEHLKISIPDVPIEKLLRFGTDETYEIRETETSPVEE